MIFNITAENGPNFTAGLSAINKVHVAQTGDLPMAPATDSKLVYTWYCEHNLGSWTASTGLNWNDYRIPYAGVYSLQAKLEYYRSGRSRPYAAFWSNRLTINAGKPNG